MTYQNILKRNRLIAYNTNEALELAIETLKDMHESYGTMHAYNINKTMDLRPKNNLELIFKLLEEKIK